MDKVLFTSKFTESVFQNAEFEDKNKQEMKFTKPSKFQVVEEISLVSLMDQSAMQV